tara:strand:+ start:4350 stop:4961 length:612 start_codon:yes stop_codon:yes gene_type:complete
VTTPRPVVARPVVARRAFLGGTAAATLGALLTACTTEQADAASPNEIDIGFCQDMAFHHEQALAMCQRVLGTDTGSQVQTAAADILQNQSYERGMMHTWLQSWGESTAPPSTVMGWMGMEMAADMMPGLATDEEMRELALAEGLEKGRMFLELMRTHHVGGVHMAEAATGAATAPVRQIAAQAALVQAYEIEIFDELLATSYA